MADLGGAPNIAQRLLIDRVIRTTMQIEALDAKLAADNGNWTDIDARTHNGLVNRQRLLLRELGLRPASAAPVDRMAALRAHFARTADEAA